MAYDSAQYAAKFAAHKSQVGFARLNLSQQTFLELQAKQYKFTLQELKALVDATIDLTMWDEGSIAEWWAKTEGELGNTQQGRERKRALLGQLRQHLDQLVMTRRYRPGFGADYGSLLTARASIVAPNEQTIFGLCPVHSEKTLCCRLRTLDVVKNCGFGCSYCAIQTMFSNEPVTFTANLAERLQQLTLDPKQFYHIGTGQSSDALAWGDHNGMLSELMRFAADHPNVLLEFKTKSANVDFFLKRPIPRNVVCSWSLNSEPIVNCEEHLTAPLKERLQAAYRVAERGIKVAFHFHPLVQYVGWQEDYAAVTDQVLQGFAPEQVAFVSFGSVTLPKPVIQKIREYQFKSKVLQMPMATNPEGKITYPPAVKLELFSALYAYFRPWHGQVFFYLCMEEKDFWHSCFGQAYANNFAFENDFNRCVRAKVLADQALAQFQPG